MLMKSIPPSPAMGPGVCILEGQTVILRPLKFEKHQGHRELQCTMSLQRKKKEKRSHPHISKQTLSPGGSVETADDSAVTPVIH